MIAIRNAPLKKDRFRVGFLHIPAVLLLFLLSLRRNPKTAALQMLNSQGATAWAAVDLNMTAGKPSLLGGACVLECGSASPLFRFLD
jgi:hypothetical protein